MKNLFKRIEDIRIDWLKRDGSIYFSISDMIFKYPFLSLFSFLLILKARITNTCIIHAIGDSHTKPFIFNPPFLVHHISQATAYNLNKINSYSKSSAYLKMFLSKINKERDIVFLVFGEIDARVHIYLKYGDSGKTITISALLDETVRRYGEVIRHIKDEGFTVCVHGITPASNRDFIADLPFLGKPWERNMIHREFNKKLKLYCQSIGVVYVDLRSIGADARGYIAEYYREDDVHFSRKIVSFARRTIIESCQNTHKF